MRLPRMLLGTQLQFDGSNHGASFRNISKDASSASPLFYCGDIFATSRGLWRTDNFDESPIISNPKTETGWTAAALWWDSETLSSKARNEWSPNNIQEGGGVKEEKKIHFLFVAGCCGGKVLAWRMEGYHHLLHHRPSDLRVSQSNEEEGKEQRPTTLAEDLGEISCLAFNRSGDFLAVGLSQETWVLRLLKDEQRQQIVEVEHYATLDTGEGGGRLLELHFVVVGGVGDMRNLLLTVGQCCHGIKLWCTKSLECICKSSAPSGHHSITSASVYGDVIALGNSNGDIHLLSLVTLQRRRPECNITIRVAGSINVSTTMRHKSASMSYLSSEKEEQESGRSNVPWVSSKIKRKDSLNRPGMSMTNYSTISNSTVLANFEDNGSVQVACEILDMTFVCNGESVTDSRPREQLCAQEDQLIYHEPETTFVSALYLVVGTNIGMAMINVRSREVTSILLFSQMLEGSVFATMASSLSLTHAKDSVHCIAVRAKQEDDKKTCMTFSASLSHGNGSFSPDISVIASTTLSECSFLHHKNLHKPQSTLSLCSGNAAAMMDLAPQRRRTKSSGYGNNLQRRQMFLPKINAPKSRKKLCPRDSNCFPEFLDLPAPNLKNCDDSSRARWSKRPETKHPSKTTPLCQNHRLPSASGDDNYPPSTLCCHLKIWSTDGARTRLRFSPSSGRAAALATSSSCDNTIQIFRNMSFSSKHHSSSPTAVHDGDLALSGHSGEVRSMDFSHRGDLLVTAGNDRVVKIWNWKRCKVPMMSVTSSHGSEGKGAAGLAYGAADMKRRPETIFPDAVIKSQFYYVDQFLLSASSNSIFVHQLGLLQGQEERPRKRGSLPSSIASVGENWYKLSKTFKLDGCKHVTDFSAVNQFYSYLVLCACSDRSLRVLDLNRQAVCHEVPSLHQRPAHCLVQAKGASSSSADHNEYNLFATAAPGDGAKLWDLRTRCCVQRFDWPGNSSGCRVASGLDISPCLRFLATGSDDGGTYVFDIRRNVGGGGCYLRRLQGQRPAADERKKSSSSCSSAAVTDVAFSPCLNFVASGTQDGDILLFRR